MSSTTDGPRRPASTPIFDQTRDEPGYSGLHPVGGAQPATAAGVPGPSAPQQAVGTAMATGQAAVDASAEVAGTAKEQAAEVASSAVDQAKDLYGRFIEQLASHAEVQQGRAAGALKTASDDLGSMHEVSSGGLAAELVQDLGRRAGAVGTWLDERDPSEVLGEVRRFAASKPLVFIGVAALTGVLAGRLTRALTAPHESDAAANGGTES